MVLLRVKLAQYTLDPTEWSEIPVARDQALFPSQRPCADWDTKLLRKRLKERQRSQVEAGKHRPTQEVRWQSDFFLLLALRLITGSVTSPSFVEQRP
jgi:hypothetical protein